MDKAEDGYGPLALYVGGAGEVRFKDVSHSKTWESGNSRGSSFAQLPDAAYQRYVLFLVRRRGGLQPRRRHGRGSRTLYLLWPRLYEIAGNLSFHNLCSVVTTARRQLPIRLRLQWRRLARHSDRNRAPHSIHQPERGIAPLAKICGAPERPKRDYAAERCRWGWETRVGLRGGGNRALRQVRSRRSDQSRGPFTRFPSQVIRRRTASASAISMAMDAWIS